MRKFAIIAMCLIVLGVGFNYFYRQWQIEKGKAEEFKTWQEFNPESRLFKVELPSKPEYAAEWITIPNSDQKRRYDMYVSEKIDGTLFLVNVITYPPKFADSAQDILRQNIDEFVHRQSRVENRLTKAVDQVFESRKAIDFAFEDKEFKGEGKAIQNGNTIYILIYTAQQGEFDPQEYQKFIKSFHILEKK
jgi:hypothetical protein